MADVRGIAGGETPVLEINQMEHRLGTPGGKDEFVLTVDVTDGIAIWPGSFAAILGDSGCGKTTLLTILGLLRRPWQPEKIGWFRFSCPDSSGKQVTHNIADLWKRDRQHQIERLRRRSIGFGLQSGDLLGALTARENIAVPLQLNDVSQADSHERVNGLLRAFELDVEVEPSAPDVANGGARRKKAVLSEARVNKLSGGQYQRVVLARAIAHRPRIAFVDEPTSALNREMAHKAISQLRDSIYHGDSLGAVVMITHDEKLADEFADTIIRMKPEKVRNAGYVSNVEVRPRHDVHAASEAVAGSPPGSAPA